MSNVLKHTKLKFKKLTAEKINLYFSAAFFMKGLFFMKYSTKFISATREHCELKKYVAAPYLRKSFELDFKPEKAEMLICGLGFYELWLNGEHITKSFLAPYISNSDDLLYYDRYDLTEKLKKGKNTLAFCLGNGNHNCLGGEIWDLQLARYRSAPKLALCFECFGEGKELCFEADDSFKVHASPTYFDDLRCGECYDARNEIDGWSLSEFDDSKWGNAFSVESPSGECREGIHTPIKKSESLNPSSFIRAVFQNDPSTTAESHRFPSPRMSFATTATFMISVKISRELSV